MFRGVFQEASIDLASAGFSCFLSLLSIVGTGQASAQITVSSISIQGNHAIESGQIQDWFSTKTGRPFSSEVLQNDLRMLLSRYHENGYLLARIDSSRTLISADSDFADILVFLSEDRQAVVRSIELKGNASIAAEILVARMETRAGGAFIPSVLEHDAQSILWEYESGGYPVARVSIETISAVEGKENEIKITLAIEEGAAVRVSELTIDGNRTTNDDVIVREARMDENQVYTEQLGERLKRRLEKLDLFSSVSVPQFYISGEGKGGLFIRVSEGNPNLFDGVLGYVPGTNQGQKGFVTGLVDVQLRNLFGTGRRLATRWYRENQVTQELALRYMEPWLASLPVNAIVGFFQRKQDSTYVRQTFDGSLAVMVTEELSAGFSIEQANVFRTDRPGNPVGGSRALNFGLSVFFDSRDSPVLPTGGVLYRTTYEIGTKVLEGRAPDRGRSEDRTGRLTFDLENYLSPLSRQVLALAGHIRDFQSSIIDQSDLFRLGGAASLRGYRESQFVGSRIIWGTIEYRFLSGGKSFFYGFLDAGSIVVPENALAGLKKSEQTKLGYGVGVRLDTSLGLIGVSLALGEDDTLRTGKLHLRLVNEF